MLHILGGKAVAMSPLTYIELEEKVVRSLDVPIQKEPLFSFGNYTELAD